MTEKCLKIFCLLFLICRFFDIRENAYQCLACSYVFQTSTDGSISSIEKEIVYYTPNEDSHTEIFAIITKYTVISQDNKDILKINVQDAQIVVYNISSFLSQGYKCNQLVSENRYYSLKTLSCVTTRRDDLTIYRNMIGQETNFTITQKSDKQYILNNTSSTYISSKGCPFHYSALSQILLLIFFSIFIFVILLVTYFIVLKKKKNVTESLPITPQSTLPVFLLAEQFSV
ncbi:hypothetical protein WA158_001749 [Blastocystis sp. Blastoise]